jgi:nucleotide-binding universal stress UspA family protein
MERSKTQTAAMHPGFNRILLAVNDSAHSAAAVGVVAAIAGKSNSAVLVLHAWNADDVLLEERRSLASALPEGNLVAGAVARLRALGLSASGESSDGTSKAVAAVIASRADSFDADLIALGNPGFSELHSFLVGSPTHQVLAQATRPVLAVRNVAPRRGNSIGRVVIALDGSDEYASVLEACVAVAEPASAEVEVIDYGNRNDPWQCAVWLAKHGVTSTWRSAPSSNHAADEVLGAAQHPRADLLIIGATSPSISRPLPAYVMNRVLQSCPCPLLIVPARDLASSRRASQVVVDPGVGQQTV